MKIKDLLKTEDIITATSDETMSAVLNQLGSSHDAAFVFDGDEFLGVVNPYHCVIKKSYPANAKIQTCLTHPPKIQLKGSLQEAARLMIESKVHYLPVFDDKKFVGIVSARRTLKHILESDKLRKTLGEHIQARRPLITIKDTDYISKAMTLFKKHKVSKLVVVNSGGALAGILAYYDIINHISMPRQRQNYASRQGNKDSLMKKAVKNFAQTNVITMNSKNTYADVVASILKKKVGSVIVVDAQKYPVGIVTTKDILGLFSSKPPIKLVTLNARGLSGKGRSTARVFANRLNTFLKKNSGVKSARITVIEKKKGGLFEGVLSILTQNKQKHVVRKEGRNLSDVLTEVKKKGKRVLSK